MRVPATMRHRLVASIAFSALLIFAAAIPVSASGTRRFAVPVILYHRIAPDSERRNSIPDLVLAPEIFERQLSVLKAAGWTTVTAATLAEHLRSNEPLPPKTMVVTIDDGYADGYTHALPILQRLGFVATFYVITSRIDHLNYLSVAQIQEMAAVGMEIANHTSHHRPPKTFDARALALEVSDAQEQLRAWLGTAPTTFAYPFGLHPRALVRAVGAAGISLAFTTAEGFSHPQSSALLAPRVRIPIGATRAQILRLFGSFR